MMRKRIEPSQYPRQAGESWWIVHPNQGGAEFRVPVGAMTVCIEDFMEVFKTNVAYNVVSADNHNGWVTVEGNGDLYEMPQYLFARHFDAEAFVVGNQLTPGEIERLKPYTYRPMMPVTRIIPGEWKDTNEDR
jgi:hypothetical protein